MATIATNTSPDYTQTLKAIKDEEEDTNRQIGEKKKQLEAEVQQTHEEAEKTLAAARKKAEEFVNEQAEQARTAAQQEVEKLIESKTKEADVIASRRLSPSEIKHIIQDVLLSEFK
jgi:vacuolar-type H+-ATPase subunit H